MEYEITNDNEIRIEELKDYLLFVHDLRKSIKETQGDKADTQHFYFRGQANWEWDVVPGIFRGNLLAYEAELIYNAYLRNPSEFSSLSSEFEKLAKLQHYGLPTRLLDITVNPLVALYFACQPHKELVVDEKLDSPKTYAVPTDGIVYFQRTYSKSYTELEIAALSYLASLELKGSNTLDDILLDLEERRIYSPKMASDCRKNKYRSLIDLLQHNYFVVPNLSNDRLSRQSGAFVIAGQYNIIVDKENIGNSILQKAQGSLKGEFDDQYIRIPAEKKADILDELDFYNINEGALFPELEHQMLYIKRNQTKYGVQNIGQFFKLQLDNDVYESIDVSSINNLSDSQIKDIILNTVNEKVPESMRQDCVDILVSNLTIDWYTKENIISKMRLEMVKLFERTPQYNREMARDKAQDILDAILGKITTRYRYD